MKKPYQIDAQRAVKELEAMATDGNPAVQMMLPMAEMVGWLRKGVGELIRQAGLQVMELLMQEEVRELVGEANPKSRPTPLPSAVPVSGRHERNRLALFRPVLQQCTEPLLRPGTGSPTAHPRASQHQVPLLLREAVLPAPRQHVNGIAGLAQLPGPIRPHCALLVPLEASACCLEKKLCTPRTG